MIPRIQFDARLIELDIRGDAKFTITQARRAQVRRAFTLIETSVAMIIVTVAITAMCELLAAGTTANVAGNELTTAVNLANTIHEIAIAVPNADSHRVGAGVHRDLWDLDGQIFSPAIDAGGAPIQEYTNWEQRLSVQPLDEDNLGSQSQTNRKTPTARLTVGIYHSGRLVHTASWLVFAPDPS